MKSENPSLSIRPIGYLVGPILTICTFVLRPLLLRNLHLLLLRQQWLVSLTRYVVKPLH